MTAPVFDITEKALQKNVIAFAKQMGWNVHTTWVSMHSPRGWPDLSLWRQKRSGLGLTVPEGELVFIELKREKGRNAPGVVNGVTAEQQAWLDRLAKVPGVKWCGVIRPSDWFAGALDEVLR